ncbi:MAG: hypothetical protein K6A32_00585 [Bacteroidales bacterium]|nr:hypothetical protein [Bacteroidales bacterium]
MKTLKNRIYWMSILFMGVVGFTSCDTEYWYDDEDDEIGYTVSGHWFGDLDMYSYNGERAQGSEIEFRHSGSGYYRGTGVEVDYYYYSRPVTNYFDWEVRNRKLYLYFDDSDLDCVIVNYRLSATYFTGYIEGYDGYSTRFSLRNYDRYWDEYGYGGYYYRSALEDTDSVNIVKGIRGCNRKTETTGK